METVKLGRDEKCKEEVSLEWVQLEIVQGRKGSLGLWSKNLKEMKRSGNSQGGRGVPVEGRSCKGPREEPAVLRSTENGMSRAKGTRGLIIKHLNRRLIIRREVNGASESCHDD